MEKRKSPYKIIKHRHVTEKANVLANLAGSESNKCLKKCVKPKAVFIVDINAGKKEIAKAIEKIYAKKNIKVTKVNTVTVKPKKKRVRGFLGKTTAFKKAVVTFSEGDSIDEQV